jgi:hypothetical protein
MVWVSFLTPLRILLSGVVVTLLLLLRQDAAVSAVSDVGCHSCSVTTRWRSEMHN